MEDVDPRQNLSPFPVGAQYSLHPIPASVPSRGRAYIHETSIYSPGNGFKHRVFLLRPLPRWTWRRLGAHGKRFGGGLRAEHAPSLQSNTSVLPCFQRGILDGGLVFLACPHHPGSFSLCSRTTVLTFSLKGTLPTTELGHKPLRPGWQGPSAVTPYQLKVHISLCPLIAPPSRCQSLKRELLQLHVRRNQTQRAQAQKGKLGIMELKNREVSGLA